VTVVTLHEKYKMVQVQMVTVQYKATCLDHECGYEASVTRHTRSRFLFNRPITSADHRFGFGQVSQ